MPTGKYTLSDLAASPEAAARSSSSNQTGQYSAADLAGPAPAGDQEQIRAAFEAENTKPLTFGRMASETGKMFASPITGLLGIPAALREWWNKGHGIEAPMSTPHLPGDNGNPVVDAVNDLAAAVPPAVQVAKLRGRIINRAMGESAPPPPGAPPAGTAPVIPPSVIEKVTGALAKKYPAVKAARFGYDLYKAYQEATAEAPPPPKPAPTVGPILGPTKPYRTGRISQGIQASTTAPPMAMAPEAAGGAPSPVGALGTDFAGKMGPRVQGLQQGPIPEPILQGSPIPDNATPTQLRAYAPAQVQEFLRDKFRRGTISRAAIQAEADNIGRPYSEVAQSMRDEGMVIQDDPFASGRYDVNRRGKAIVSTPDVPETTPGSAAPEAVPANLQGNHKALAAARALQEALEDGTIPANGATSGESSGIQAGAGGAGAAVQGPAQASPGTGARTTVSIPGEPGGYEANYAVRELSDVQPSHSGMNFEPNPKYGLKNDRDYTNRDNQGKVLNGALPRRFDPRFHITDNPDATNGPVVIDSQGNVLGGNGRGMILQRVYGANAEGAQAYRQMLVDKAAQFGLDPESIRGMKQPVLVRQISAEVENPGQAITDLNKTGTAALRPAERAIADSKAISPATLEDVGGRLERLGQDATLAKALEGKAGAEVLNSLIDDGVISPQERAGLASGDSLTKAGQDRISKLMLGRFFEDPAQMDAVPPAVRNKLERIVAPLARIEGTEWSLTESVAEAMSLIEQTRAHGGTIDNFIKQEGLLSTKRYSPQAVTIAKALQKMPARDLVEAVNKYAQDAQFAGGGESLFGETPTPAGSFAALKKAGENPRKGL